MTSSSLFSLQAQVDAVAGKAMLAATLPGFNGFHRIFHDICECLAKLAAIANHREFALGRVDREQDSGMGDFVQEQRLAGDGMDILLAERRLGHAREVGEFIDHPAKVADLADDRPGQPLERVLVGFDFLGEAPLQALGGELDRSQRVLDLMRDAPGDVRPGGTALVGKLVGDVVEGQDGAVLVADALDGERALHGSDRELDVGLRLVPKHEMIEIG